MYETRLTIEQNLTLLVATRSRLAKITQGPSAAQLVTPSGPGEWSAREVLAHRAKLLAVLKPLAPQAWTRAAMLMMAAICFSIGKIMMIISCRSRFRMR